VRLLVLKLVQAKYVTPAFNPNENTKNKPSSFAFSKIRRTWSSHVVVVQRTAKKCTKIYNARAQPLFYSLNLLFGGVLVAVAVVVCLTSLLRDKMCTCLKEVGIP